MPANKVTEAVQGRFARAGLKLCKAKAQPCRETLRHQSQAPTEILFCFRPVSDKKENSPPEHKAWIIVRYLYACAIEQRQSLRHVSFLKGPDRVSMGCGNARAGLADGADGWGFVV